MNTTFAIALVIGLISLVVILLIGLFSMIKGGEFNKKYGNKLMQARVVLQTIIILALLIAFYSSN